MVQADYYKDHCREASAPVCAAPWSTPQACLTVCLNLSAASAESVERRMHVLSLLTAGLVEFEGSGGGIGTIGLMMKRQHLDALPCNA